MESSYVYRKEVDWSLLNEGLTLPIDHQIEFGQIMGRFLKKGESKQIRLLLDNKVYPAKIQNVNFNEKHNRKKDTLQIRYAKSSELAGVLQKIYFKSFRFIENRRLSRDPSDRSMIRLPHEQKEYLAFYTTEYDDMFIIEPITFDDIVEFKNYVKNKNEHLLESQLLYQIDQTTPEIMKKTGINRIRKLDYKIGENLKRLYQYRCQICGKPIGEEYGIQVSEAHHIDYFSKSLNNDSSNQLIVCPNHHRIIHAANPVFDRKRKLFVFENDVKQNLQLNFHL